ncbi:MAG: glucan biosynthesis protein, partial [Verrucomicrobiota bacterium]|nr:glucan biosynthesis protein [Verrucomicrobiota bacterium]
MKSPSALLLTLGVLLFARAVRADEAPLDFDTLRYRAKLLAAKPYAPPPSRIPQSLLKLTYDQYRDIRFKPAKTW